MDTTSPPRSTVDFFVSYVADDVGWAEWVAWELEQAGYSAIIQKWDFSPGSNTVLEVHKAVEASNHVIAIMSPRYFEALDVRTEWAAALNKSSGDRQTLIPLRVAECAPAGLLAALATIDLMGLDEQQAHAALMQGIASISGARAKPSAAPRYPVPRAGLRPDPPYPNSSQPTVWNVPYRRNRDFIGREHLLESVAAALEDSRIAAASQTVAGLGGVGKTQLIVEYAYRKRDRYNAVWWIRAEKPATLVSDYASLGATLALPESSDPDQVTALTAVRHWLENNDNWLLIFDNAEDPDSGLGLRWPFESVKDLLPRLGSGHVVITTRDTRWDSIAPIALVDVFIPAEAIRFVKAHADNSDGDLAGELAEALGRLPLALDQACAYIRQSGIGIRDYLQRLTSAPQLFLDAPRDYRGTVATTWQVSIERVRQATPLAEHLLQVCAFFAADNIPFDLIAGEEAYAALSGLAASPSSQLVVDEAIIALRRYSLVKADNQRLTIHRLLQEVVRTSLADEVRADILEKAIKLLCAVFPAHGDEVSSWAQCDSLLSHALAGTGHAISNDLASNKIPLILYRVGIYLQARARYREAKECFEQALVVVDSDSAASPMTRAKILTALGSVMRDLGEHDGALSYFDRALSLYSDDRLSREDFARALMGHGLVLRDVGQLGRGRAELAEALAAAEQVDPSSSLTADILDVFGRVLRTSGDMPAARVYLQRALTIRESTHGPMDPRVGLTLMVLGRVLGDLGDLPEALADLERALRVLESSYGPEHPEVARTLTFLGNLLRILGRYEEARVHIERSLAIKERIYAADHPEVTITSSALGRILGDLGRLQEARECLEQSLAAKEAFHGPQHLEVAITLAFLAGVLQKLGNLSEARIGFERALAINEAVYGPDHPEVGMVLTGLGLVLRDLGELAQARAHLQRALMLLETHNGRSHPEVANTLSIYGRVLRTLGELPQARDYLQRSLHIRESAYGPDHPLVAATLTNLGRVLCDLGELSVARADLERALAIHESLGDQLAANDDHPETIRIITDLGRVLRNQGELRGSRAYLERALAMAQSLYDSGHPALGIAHSALGDLLSEMGEFALARSHLEKSLGIKVAFFGPQHLEVAISLSILGNLLYRMGHLEQARTTLERALAIDEAAYGRVHPEVAVVLARLSFVLRDLGEITQARTYAERAMVISTETLGRDHVNVSKLRNEVAMLTAAERPALPSPDAIG